MRSRPTLPRVLMLSDVYFPRVNGVSTSIQTFRRDLAALGCSTALVAPAYPGAVESAAGVHRVRSRYLPFDPEDRVMRWQDLNRAASTLAPRFDLVHVQTPFLAHYVGLRLARHHGLRVVETYHTFFEEYLHHYMPLTPRRLSAKLARSLSRAQCNAVDAVVSPSKQMGEALQRYGVTTPIDVIPTGLDMSRFSNGDGQRFRRGLGIDADRPVLLSVGRVAFEKNFSFLIDVLARVRRSAPEVLLIIAGEGPALEHLKRYARRCRVEENIRFVGYLDRDSTLLDCYRSADLFVFGSRTETQGLVLLEAMALGTPVVSTAIMGTRAVLEDSAGALIAPEDSDEFAAVVLGLLKDRSLCRRLGEEAARFVRARWSSAEMARQMLVLYERLLGRDREAGPKRYVSCGSVCG